MPNRRFKGAETHFRAPWAVAYRIRRRIFMKAFQNLDEQFLNAQITPKKLHFEAPTHMELEEFDFEESLNAKFSEAQFRW